MRRVCGITVPHTNSAPPWQLLAAAGAAPVGAAQPVARNNGRIAGSLRKSRAKVEIARKTETTHNLYYVN